MDLRDFAAKDKSPIDGFDLFGVVKEVGVDDEGLSEFHSKYYPYDLYRDQNLVFYNDFFGGQKLGLRTWNPVRLFRGMRSMSKRIEGKSIDGNLIGEGFVQGGVVLFDRDGKARYAYREETGRELPFDDIAAAALAIREEKK